MDVKFAVTLLWASAGTLNPAGAPAANVALPVAVAFAVNEAVPSTLPPVMVTSEGDRVPCDGAEFEIGTRKEPPPLTCCVSTNRKEESSLAADTVRGAVEPWLKAKLAPIPPGPASTNPEGVRLIVAVPLGKPSALATICAVPLVAKPCTKIPAIVV